MASIETHIAGLAPYLAVSEDSCYYAVRLAAVAAVAEIYTTEK